jgi:hypothetical protein
MRKVFLLVLIGALCVTGLALVNPVDARTSPKPPQYNAYTFTKPADLSSLEDWVTSNYTDYLLRETLKPATVGDFAAVSFSSRGETGKEFNLLVDNGEALVLLTTARLNPTSPDIEGPGDSSLPWLKAVVCDTAANRCNCVLYARCRLPSLPFGLDTYADKVNIINSSSAATGSVAIININPPFGHVAYVTAVKKDIATRQVTSITVDEANYQSCQLTTRSGSPATLKVTGYFRP